MLLIDAMRPFETHQSACQDLVPSRRLIVDDRQGPPYDIL